MEREDVERERRRSLRVLDRLLPLALEDEWTVSPPPDEIVHLWKHSNDLLEVRLGNRILMLKRGVEDWSMRRFRDARAAADLLHRAGIRAPRFLDVPARVRGWPVLAWWRIPEETLEEAWPRLDAGERRQATRSWGALLRRIHDLRAPGWGPLGDASEREVRGTDFLVRDLGERLRPAVAGEWPEAVPALDALRERMSERSLVEDPSLLHNDPHFANVLYRAGETGAGGRCFGVLDLEAAMGGAPEADFAYLSAVHSPLMAGSPGPTWFEDLVEGYGREPRRDWMGMFRVYHLLNLGFHAAHAGHGGHARQILTAVRRDLGEL